jgi:hypothetical protein
MVERPIKKADRQPNSEATESGSKAKKFDGSDKNSSTRNGGDGDRRGKRDKRGGRDEEVKAPVNLALVRGPKPTKPQPIVEEIVAEESDSEQSTETAPEE